MRPPPEAWASHGVILAKIPDFRGRVFAIPLPDGAFSFAKALIFPEVLFFQARSPTPELPPDCVGLGTPLFRIWVDKAAQTGRKSWQKLGVMALTPDEQDSATYFKKDALNGKNYLYRKGAFILATQQECLGLEPAAVWSRGQVESRLSDHFLGRENIWVKSKTTLRLRDSSHRKALSCTAQGWPRLCQPDGAQSRQRTSAKLQSLTYPKFLSSNH